MKTSEVPVLIVGGGAAGTMMSLELARRGVECRTIDRLAQPGRTSRAIAFHARTAEMLERVDKRLLEPFLERGLKHKGYVLHFVDEAGRRREVRPGIDFTTIPSRYPYILSHGQSETEGNIREYMCAELGYEVDWGVECVAVEQGADGITATLVHGRDERRREQVRCRYLIACDGINSRVRRVLGLEQAESDYAGTVLQNLDVYLEDFPDVDDYFHYCAGTDHFVMVAALPGGFHRLLLSDRGEAAGPDVTPEQAFMRIMEKHFDGVSFGEVVWHSKWESWVRLAKTYRDGNVFLAGDSAHVHSTTGGQGMNCCMQDTYNLGWKLALVERGLADPKLLETYEAERKPIAEQVIWAASSLHDIFMGHGKDIAERAKQIDDPAFLDAVVGRCSGISYTYRDYVPHEEGLRDMAGPAIGDRAPDADLDDGRTLYDLTRHPGFTLLVLSSQPDRLPEADQVAGDLKGRMGDELSVHRLESTGPLGRAYGEHVEPGLFLIRPDGYVGYRCGLSEAGRLERHIGAFWAG